MPKADGVWWGKDCIFVQQLQLVQEEIESGLVVIVEIARLRTKLIERERQVGTLVEATQDLFEVADGYEFPFQYRDTEQAANALRAALSALEAKDV